MALPEITGVVAIDAKTLPQLEVASPTWLAYHPELAGWPWLVVYDAEQLAANAAMRIASSFGTDQILPWPPVGVEYESQREKMLSAFVCAVPHAVKTAWWMKIDCDAVCLRACPGWLEEAWFVADTSSEYNAWIASSWPYTKAKGGGGTIWEWCMRLESCGDAMFPETLRLNLAAKVKSDGSKLLWPRMASWISFYNTDWTRRLANGLADVCGQGKLPVPSQDTVHWYFAERTGARRLAVRRLGKRRGWTNVPRFDKLVQRVKEIMTS